MDRVIVPAPATDASATRASSGPDAATANRLIADKLRQAAELLEQQGANTHRVHAYRHAADSVASAAEDLRALFDREGMDGLLALPGVGPHIGAAIGHMLTRGQWGELERLRGSLDPERLFRTIPGVGAVLARRMHEELHVDSLEALEVAAHDGRLAALPGFGHRRAAMIRAALASLLARVRWRAGDHDGHVPSVALLLDVDAEYRARADRLPKIAPRRFNPERAAWLPVLHTERDAWHVTALFSNTAMAHRLGRTHDWVVMYFHAEHRPEGQCTVVTETHGELAGRRVIRGREPECRSHYAHAREASQSGNATVASSLHADLMEGRT
jgi:putative hydrolase